MILFMNKNYRQDAAQLPKKKKKIRNKEKKKEKE